MDLHSTFPGIADLKLRARRRVPHFVWEFLESGTGIDATLRRNRRLWIGWVFCRRSCMVRWRAIRAHGSWATTFPCPLASPPIGMSGLIGPNAEKLLARAAAEASLPYTLSTVASQSPENMAPHIGQTAWYQLYPPKDPDIRKDMLNRIKSAGFSTLVLTADVPVASRRERQTRWV